ncbi:MAG: hypothetical protein JNL39_02350 [Opitutaceae bacterium]|nr:hypothetical protein [Opitutaceae bacterium]
MKKYLLPLFLLAAVGLHAAGAKSYQVTGPIIALTDSVITVQKGDEKWEIDRSAATKVDGKLAVGAKVTISYTMVAAKVEVKEAAPSKADAAADKAADKAAKKAKKSQ